MIKTAFETGKELIKIIQEKGLRQITDKEELTKIINTILDHNTKQVAMYKNGKNEIYTYFVGQVMKETKGKANPQMVNTLLRELLKSL